MMGRPNRFLPRLRDALKTAPAPAGLSQPQLCALLQSSQAQVSRNLSALREAEEAYICRWERSCKSGGPPIAFFALGAEEDVRCTVRKLSGAERTRHHRERKRRKSHEPSVFDVLHQCFFGLGA